jgi:hypothetical protein
MSAAEDESARALLARITPGKPQPSLTAEIERCACPPEAKAGLFLLNGDWQRAHQVAQDLNSTTAAYWHALVHRHEPDFDNSKYWLRRAGEHPVFARLLEASRAEQQAGAAAPKGKWDPLKFTDCYADAAQSGWTRRLEAIEFRALLEHSLAL